MRIYSNFINLAATGFRGDLGRGAISQAPLTARAGQGSRAGRFPGRLMPAPDVAATTLPENFDRHQRSPQGHGAAPGQPGSPLIIYYTRRALFEAKMPCGKNATIHQMFCDKNITRNVTQSRFYTHVNVITFSNTHALLT
jgi:hypothetical protein